MSIPLALVIAVMCLCAFVCAFAGPAETDKPLAAPRVFKVVAGIALALIIWLSVAIATRPTDDTNVHMGMSGWSDMKETQDDECK